MDLRKLDCAVAEHVMGWTEIETIVQKHASHDSIQGVRPGTVASIHTGYKPKFVIPEYSTEIEAAWQVVDKITSQGFLLEIYHDGQGYMIQFGAKPRISFDSVNDMPHAICLAALKAVGVEVSEWEK